MYILLNVKNLIKKKQRLTLVVVSKYKVWQYLSFSLLKYDSKKPGINKCRDNNQEQNSVDSMIEMCQ